ncbi:hypothetical protein [Clostridium sp.]|uniref:hypothetical protein n=1 Tax=Clostridium sp. TaxID=1506 RepID=UPI003F2A0400
MEEIMYGSEQFKKKNGYSKKKPLTPSERKEKNLEKQSKLIEKLNRLSKKDNSQKASVNETSNNESNDKPSINDLKLLVNNIQNK